MEQTTVEDVKPFEWTAKIFGVESKDVSDNDIYNHIKLMEDQIKAMSEIEHKPKKLEKKIVETKKYITELVDFLDKRNP